MEKKIISTNNAPAAIGPYSQAVCIDKFVYTSGQIPLDPETGEIAPDIKSQTEQVMKNVKAVLEAAGTDLKHVIKTLIFIKNMGDFSTVNEIYGSYFTEAPPARSCVEAARLPKDVLIEIEAVAVK
ncbi:MAG: RidA family protein [Victivallales bacterium]|nr:RidA family protein [Victivallales bacterium]